MGFVVGLVIGIITTYIGHTLSVRRSREERFTPYLQKLYGIVSRIMRNSNAEKLRDRYKLLVNARVEGRMREIAIKDLGEEQAGEPLYLKPEFVPLIFFVESCNDLVETVRECRNFESVYSEMEAKGLVSALKVRNGRLAHSLSWFHDSTKNIANETSDFFDRLVMTN